MRANLIASSVAALALASGGANAQTVISRSISAQPVETVVTQTPTGTIVTRRPVEGQVIQPTIAQPLVAPAFPRATVIESDTVDTVTTNAAVRRAQAAPPPAMTTRQVSQTTRRATTHHAAHKTTHTTRTTTTRAAPRLALDPRERHIVYQTIVEREVVPRQQVVVAPSVVPTYVQPRIVTAPRPPIVAADEVEIVAPAGPITVGTVLPANVPLYAMPENVALSVPATQPYGYAYLGGRAFLVEPSSGTVVADVTE